MNEAHATRWILALALAAPMGCYEGTREREDEGDDGATTGGEESGEDPPEVGCEGLRPARTPLRRLTDVQYRNTIVDLFHGAVAPSDDFPETSLAYEYTNEAAADAITELAAEQVLIAAEDVADQVMTAADTVVGCELSPACIEGFIDDFGARAFRHPLTDEEHALLLAAYEEGALESPTDGLGRMVAVALQLPQFLYLLEPGELDDEDPTVARLTDHELAARLSYLLWDTLPDDELRGLADAGTLGDADALEQQARRLLADPRADAALGRFHREWLDMPPLRGTEKDPGMYPQFDAELVASMGEQFDRLVASVVRSDEPTLMRLLTADSVEIDANLAAIYGVAAPSEGWTELALDPGERAGILTTPLLLSAHATQIGSSTTHRGKMVRTRIFCHTIPAPPANAVAEAPVLPPDATERERAEALMENPECGACHTLMDGIGFGFEHFDAIGAWRTSYASGTTVDATGVLAGAPAGVADGEFDGAVELAQRISGSDDVAACYVGHFIHHARGAAATTEVEQCASEDLTTTFIESGRDLPRLVAELVRSDGFRYRDVGDAP
jgi:Protein of unknown function (DUF1592)/Protein of unknown function (DUF1588)/Protein of unknown function (DUF1587)/Protein of unknown function (DUF1595)/Protein of unknown function (DUF1585)